MSQGERAGRGGRTGRQPKGGSPPIQVQTRFERFPASLKGAFVLRGADGNPHAIRIEWARIARIPSGPTAPFAVEARMVDISPNRDLFLPFEAPVSELDPGWYVIESSIQVDGGRSWVFAGRAFSIPWPRSDVRRGTVHVGKAVRAGRGSYLVDRVEMGGDSAAVVWRPEPPPGSEETGEGPGGDAILVADVTELETLPPNVRSAVSGPPGPVDRRTVSYPVPRASRSLSVILRLGSGEQSSPLRIPLP